MYTLFCGFLNFFAEIVSDWEKSMVGKSLIQKLVDLFPSDGHFFDTLLKLSIDVTLNWYETLLYFDATAINFAPFEYAVNWDCFCLSYIFLDHRRNTWTNIIEAF